MPKKNVKKSNPPKKPVLTREKSDPIKLETFKMGVLPELIKWDEQLGYHLFQQRKSSSLLKTVSDVISMSGDEVIFFGITAAIAISMSLIRGIS